MWPAPSSQDGLVAIAGMAPHPRTLLSTVFCLLGPLQGLFPLSASGFGVCSSSQIRPWRKARGRATPGADTARLHGGVTLEPARSLSTAMGSAGGPVPMAGPISAATRHGAMAAELPFNPEGSERLHGVVCPEGQKCPRRALLAQSGAAWCARLGQLRELWGLSSLHVSGLCNRHCLRDAGL